ncbi:MAG: hypothetical protein ABI672_11040 [Vicinamibacteria bacterium]
MQALIEIWTAAGYPWSIRLKAGHRQVRLAGLHDSGVPGKREGVSHANLSARCPKARMVITIGWEVLL